MDMNTLMAIFCEEMEEYMDTPFHIYPQEDYQQPRIKSWVEQTESDDDFVVLYLNYHEKKQTLGYAAEVHFVEHNSDEYTVSVRVLWNGEAAKSAFKIGDGEVSYISDYDSDEDRENRCCMVNDIYCSETLSNEQKNAVGDLMETIRICLCHVMGDDEE